MARKKEVKFSIVFEVESKEGIYFVVSKYEGCDEVYKFAFNVNDDEAEAVRNFQLADWLFFLKTNDVRLL